jgi:hypothetical protein
MRAECIRSHIVILDKHVALRYDGNHVKAAKKEQPLLYKRTIT